MGVGGKWNVVLAAIVKDEADYIIDWISYHISIGVEHFFVYDNDSTDNTTNLLKKFINGGLVTLVSWPMRGGQVDAYSHAAKILSGNTEWLGFLDVDEFIVLHQHDDVYSFLSVLDADQVLLPWRNFPYCGHYNAPGGPSLENFFWAYRVAPGGITQVKHFVRPELVEQVTAHFSFIAGDRIRLPSGEAYRLSHSITNPTYVGAQVNHYATRSLAENQTRIQKGQVSGSSHKRLDDFVPMSPGLAERMDYDDSILRHLPKFKEERSEWKSVADYPHRFGLKQKRPTLYSYNNLIFYLAKSFGNYCSDQQVIKPLSDMPLLQTTPSGSKIDLSPTLIGYRRQLVYFDVSNKSFLKYFQGTIHYGDFVRRFGFDCFSSVRMLDVSGLWSNSVITTGGGFLALADIESDDTASIAVVRSGQAGTLAEESIPAGRHCVIVYVPDSPSKETSIELYVTGRCLVREALLGLLP